MGSLHDRRDPRKALGLLIAGNTSGRAHCQSRGVPDSESMLGLANPVSQTSTAIDHVNFYEALERERQLLEKTSMTGTPPRPRRPPSRPIGRRASSSRTCPPICGRR